jgi:poly(3-hydroxybutyrate) depolymerase
MASPCAPPSAPGPSLAGRALESALASWAAGVQGTTQYWAGALERRATPLEILADAARWWKLVGLRQEPRWATPNEVTFETPIARLRDFSSGSRARVVPTLVLPPQAGHDSCIVDYSDDQSQIKSISAAGLSRLWSLDWVGATDETKDARIEDYLAVIDRASDAIGSPLNLIGDCQGGWLATVYAALRPDRINTLTIAGAPIDFHAGGAAIGDWVGLLSKAGDAAFYRAAVAVAGGVLDGRLILNGYVGIKPENEIGKQLQLLANLHEEKHVERYQAFEDWFKHTQDISGNFYLWIVEHLFRRNALVQGGLEIDGETVDLRRISVPLQLLAGTEDHITPPPQVFALADAASTPASQITRDVTKGGHLGLFMGHRALRNHWPALLAQVLGHSKPKPRRAAAEQRARARTPRAKREIPAP